MSAWLAALLVGFVVAAAVGIVPLRRYQDRKWAEHLARQRMAASPTFQEIAEAFVQFKITVQDSLTPALAKAAAEMSKFGAALDALPRLPWWRRALLRVRAWFA